MLRSGSRCPINGLYRTTCSCSESLELVSHSLFPRCIRCDESVNWVYLQPMAACVSLASPAEAPGVERHVRKLQACLQADEGRDDPTLLFALGKALLRLGRISPALEALHGALDRAPDNPSVHLELGKALLAFRRPREALAVLERGQRMAQADAEDVRSEIAALIESALAAGNGADGRAARRVPLHVTVTRSDAIAPGAYTAVNISETGVCLRSPRREPLDTFVALDFLLGGEEIHVYAKVVWCRDDLGGAGDLPYTIGLQFLVPSRTVVERIGRYVQAVSGG